MVNCISGTLTVIIGALVFFLAYRQNRQGRGSYALLLILLGGLLLRLFAAADLKLHAWDERYHAVVAKHLMDSPLYPTLYEDPVLPYDYKDWTRNHVWLHKQPFPLWTMAGTMAVFGVHELALRLPSILLTTVGIALTFAIGRYLFSYRVGLIAAFLYAINGLIIELTAGRTTAGHIDAFFLVFIQLGVYSAIRYFQTQRAIFNILCGLATGLAILTKWLPALIVLPLWLLLATGHNQLLTTKTLKAFLVLTGVIALVVVPWQVYIFDQFPKVAGFEHAYNFKHLTTVVEGHGGPFYYHFDKARRLFGQLIYIPMAWFFFKTFKKGFQARRLLVTVWVLVPYLFFSVAQTKMQAYTIFTAPAVFIMVGVFIRYLQVFKKRFYWQKGLTLLMLLLVALPVRYGIERTKPFQVLTRNPDWARELRMLDKRLKREENTVILNASRPIETMFYTDGIAYKVVPDSAKLRKLQKKGYHILIRRTNMPAKRDATDAIRLKQLGVVYQPWKGRLS